MVSQGTYVLIVVSLILTALLPTSNTVLLNLQEDWSQKDEPAPYLDSLPSTSEGRFIVPVVNPPEPVITWEQQYNSSELKWYLDSMVECESGGFAATGATIGSGTQGGAMNDMLLVRFDEMGNALWNRSYDAGLGESGSYIVECSDGGFAIIGYQGIVCNRFQPFLFRTDSNGNLLWNRSYGGDAYYDYNIPRGLVECSDGGFAFLGSFPCFRTNYSDTWLIRLDETGNPLWNYTFEGPDYQYGSSLVRCNDGSFVIAGRRHLASYYWVPSLTRINPEGGLIWNKRYYGPEVPEMSYGQVIQCQDGGFAFTGGAKIIGGNWYDIALIRTAGNGSLLWAQTYTESESEYAYTIVECSTGGFVLAGTVLGISVNSTDTAIVIRTDAQGVKLWDLNYGENDIANSVIEASDGGFVLLGNNNDELWLFRVIDYQSVLLTVNWSGALFILVVLSLIVLGVGLLRIRKHSRLKPPRQASTQQSSGDDEID